VHANFGMHSNHGVDVHAKLACTSATMVVVHAILACTLTLWLLCMPVWHAHQPCGFCACQIGMHNSHVAYVHAKLALTTATGLFCMRACMCGTPYQ
jgi:hypothetical protein